MPVDSIYSSNYRDCVSMNPNVLLPNVSTRVRARMSVTLALLLLPALDPSQSVAGQVDRTLDIYWIDVEGGRGTLIVTPSGESVLIDSGNPGARDSGRIHRVATETAGLKKIDHYITTHFHTD